MVSQDTLRMVYFANVHSVMSYGIMMWGNSTHTKKVFTLQKKCIRILANANPKASCRILFRKLNIMTIYAQYIYSLALHTVSNMHLFIANGEIHRYETRANKDLHRPSPNSTKYTKGPYYTAIKVYITYQDLWRTWRLTKRDSNTPWKGFYASTHFTPLRSFLTIRNTCESYITCWKNDF